MHLSRLVNHCHSYESASDIFDLISRFPLQHSYLHLMNPKQNYLPIPAPSTSAGLSNFHFVHFDEETGSAFGKYHSKYSIPIEFDVDCKEGFKKKSKRGEQLSEGKRS